MKKKDIYVKYCTNLVRRGDKNKFCPPGWYIFVPTKRTIGSSHEALLDLRFFREKDAWLAAKALVAAGYTDLKKLREAPAEDVIEKAISALQW
jgi:hypothetical protein